MDPQAALK